MNLESLTLIILFISLFLNFILGFEIFITRGDNKHLSDSYNQLYDRLLSTSKELRELREGKLGYRDRFLLDDLDGLRAKNIGLLDSVDDMRKTINDLRTDLSNANELNRSLEDRLECNNQLVEDLSAKLNVQRGNVRSRDNELTVY